jgi:uncharacterized membrane protein YeaQ/YmgE (transglycosylase-associated protein family)
MLSYALFAAQFLWPAAFLCTLLALLTTRRPRTQWVRSVLLGILGSVGTGYLTAAAGWYFALSGMGLLVVAVVGGAVAACFLPRLIAPDQRSNQPPEPADTTARADTAASSAGHSAPSR